MKRVVRLGAVLAALATLADVPTMLSKGDFGKWAKAVKSSGAPVD
jgi:hypothetical protein